MKAFKLKIAPLFAQIKVKLLKSPNSPNTGVVVLKVGVLDSIGEILFPRKVVIDLSRTPIGEISKTTKP